MKRTTFNAKVLAVLSILATVALGWSAFAAGSSLEVVGYQVSGNVLQVTLHNPGADAGSGVLSVGVALTGGSVSSASQPITLAGGQTVTLALAFSAPVDEVGPVGMSDDHDPF